MATEQPGFKDGTKRAAADLSALQFRFVALDVNGNIAQQTVAGARSYGVLNNKPTINQAAEVVIFGISKVAAGGTVAAGAPVATDNVGRAVAAVAGNYVIGKATIPAAIGDIMSVMLTAEGVL